MKTIKVQKLSREAFRPFGDFVDLINDPSFDGKEDRTNVFTPNLLPFFLDGRTPATVNASRLKDDKKIVTGYEWHSYTCEVMVALDGDMIIFVGAELRGPAAIPEIEAFYVPQGTVVKLNPGVLHGRQFTAGKEDVHVLILLPTRTFANDVGRGRLEEADQVLIED